MLAGEIKTLDQLVTAGLVGRQALLAAQVQRTNFGPVILANTGSFAVALDEPAPEHGPRTRPGRRAGIVRPRTSASAGLLEDRALAFDAAAAAREALANRPDLRGLRAAVRALERGRQHRPRRAIIR